MTVSEISNSIPKTSYDFSIYYETRRGEAEHLLRRRSTSHSGHIQLHYHQCSGIIGTAGRGSLLNAYA